VRLAEQLAATQAAPELLHAAVLVLRETPEGEELVATVAPRLDADST